MKFAIIVALLTLLAIPYSQAAFSCLKGNSKAKKPSENIDPRFEVDVFRPENSLVFITDKEGLMMGGVLVKKDCVITLYRPLLETLERYPSYRELFVGVGTEPLSTNLERYLHPVDDRIYDFVKRYRSYARIKKVTIIMFQANVYGLSGCAKTIPIVRRTAQRRELALGAEVVGWGKDGKVRKYLIENVLSRNSNQCTNSSIPVKNEEVDNLFKGGFLTRSTFLTEIVVSYRYSDEKKREIILVSSKFYFTDQYIKDATNGKYGDIDLYEERLPVPLDSEASSSAFSDEND